MILTEFDQEEYEKMIKEESYEDGVQQGIKLTKQVVKLYSQGKKKEEIAEQLKIKKEMIDAILD